MSKFVGHYYDKPLKVYKVYSDGFVCEAKSQPAHRGNDYSLIEATSALEAHAVAKVKGIV